MPPKDAPVSQHKGGLSSSSFVDVAMVVIATRRSHFPWPFKKIIKNVISDKRDMAGFGGNALGAIGSGSLVRRQYFTFGFFFVLIRHYILSKTFSKLKLCLFIYRYPLSEVLN